MPNAGHAKLLTVVTTTKNSIDLIEGYMTSFSLLDASLFDWIIVDAGSADGTKEYLEGHRWRFSWLTSAPDDGLYFGLNKAIAQVKTKYYIVFGADDRPSASFLNEVLPLLGDSGALILGATRLQPSGIVKYPGPRLLHHWTWGRVISHHSVGTVIRTDLHAAYGLYDVRFRILADGAFIKRVLQSNEKVISTRVVFGDYNEGGVSGREAIASIWESFLVQVDAGANLPLQLALLCMRLLRNRPLLRPRGVPR